VTEADDIQLPALRDSRGVSVALPPWGYDLNLSLQEIFAQTSSPAGHSSISTFLACPEKARLRRLGVRRKSQIVNDDGLPDEYGATEIGSLVHHLLAGRIIHGQDAVEALLEYAEGDFGLPLPVPEDVRQKLYLMMRVYDEAYPIAEEPFEYLAVEAEIMTDISGAKEGPACLRSARYDAVVRMREGPHEGTIWSLEHKTASRGGIGAINQYLAQYETQVAVWNRNPYLVAAYGPMRGVIPDLIIKKAVPEVERAYREISPTQVDRIVQYLRLPEQITFKVAADGSHPRMRHNCFKGWPPCEYLELCDQDAQNLYETR
jgi:hypothetical protein